MSAVNVEETGKSFKKRLIYSADKNFDIEKLLAKFHTASMSALCRQQRESGDVPQQHINSQV